MDFDFNMLLFGATAGGLIAAVISLMDWRKIRCWLGYHDMKNTESTFVPGLLRCRSCTRAFRITPEGYGE